MYFRYFRDYLPLAMSMILHFKSPFTNLICAKFPVRMWKVYRQTDGQTFKIAHPGFQFRWAKIKQNISYSILFNSIFLSVFALFEHNTISFFYLKGEACKDVYVTLPGGRMSCSLNNFDEHIHRRKTFVRVR